VPHRCSVVAKEDPTLQYICKSELEQVVQQLPRTSWFGEGLGSSGLVIVWLLIPLLYVNAIKLLARLSYKTGQTKEWLSALVSGRGGESSPRVPLVEPSQRLVQPQID
jgi:hypothetical protein